MATSRHKVFVSYHHANDEHYRNKFEDLFCNVHDIMISQSVQIGDINPYADKETIRRTIRDNYLRDTTVTIVLIGTETWKRKHVDWEIGSSLRHTLYNSRSAVIGILLPSYPVQWDWSSQTCHFNPYTIPPRLYKNVEAGYSKIYNWCENPYILKDWIHEAFLNRFKNTPTNSYPTFRNNRSGLRWYS